MLSFALLLQEVAPPPDWLQSVMNFLDTPAPYSPLTEYLAILFLLWLLARRDTNRRSTFDHKAQEVLDRKLQEGEIDRKTYEKYRQEMSLRPKR